MKIPIKTYNTLLKELNYIWNRPGDCSDFARTLNAGDNKKTYAKFGVKVFRGIIPLSQSALHFTNRMNDASKTEFVWRIGQTALLLRSLEEKEAILFTYKAIDKVIEMKNDENVKCKKGCAFCCYQQVLINEAEGRFLTDYLAEHPDLVDAEQLNRHRLWPHHSMRELNRQNDSDSWNGPKIEDKRCPMLNPKKGLCNIYEVRPMPCRIHQAISDPENCDPAHNRDVSSPNHAQNAALVSAWLQFSDILPLAHGISLPTAR